MSSAPTGAAQQSPMSGQISYYVAAHMTELPYFLPCNRVCCNTRTWRAAGSGGVSPRAPAAAAGCASRCRRRDAASGTAAAETPAHQPRQRPASSRPAGRRRLPPIMFQLLPARPSSWQQRALHQRKLLRWLKLLRLQSQRRLQRRPRSGSQRAALALLTHRPQGGRPSGRPKSGAFRPVSSSQFAK